MNIEKLKAQVSALQIQPGTVVVLSLNLDTSDNWLTAKAMAEQLRHAVPQENPLLVLQRPAEIQALDEAQMHELGWVRQSAVDDALSTIDELADASTAVSNVAYNLGQKHAEWSDIISPAISRLDAARNAARGAIKRAQGGA